MSNQPSKGGDQTTVSLLGSWNGIWCAIVISSSINYKDERLSFQLRFCT